MSENKTITEDEKKKLEKLQKEENEMFMKGIPNREEVAQYVNSLMEQKYMKEIVNYLNSNQQSTQLGFMAIQAILVNKGICTGDEIEEVIKQFIEQLEESQKEEPDPAQSEEQPNNKEI